MEFGFVNRYQFKCPNCMAIFSIPTPKVRFLRVYSVIAGFADKILKIVAVGNNKTFNTSKAKNILWKFCRTG